MGEVLESIDEIIEKYSKKSTPLRKGLYVSIGCVFIVFAIIGIWVPGWPTVSWAVPAAYLFSISNERLFRWTLTNRWFGPSLFNYYATGKTLPKHVKNLILIIITVMSIFSIWVTTLAGDPGYGQAFIFIVWIIGIYWVNWRINTRNLIQ
ncbi:MAG: YbaN family protein [Candidatus Thalassarchaeaceae archaeon]|jgi:hypothetical protein|nr:YbaN family protein [Candidatus Thalassarchaeaceae archaeon]